LETGPEHIDDLIAAYFLGEATPEQVAFVEEWKDRDDRNRRYFEHLSLILEKAAAMPKSVKFDTDVAWAKVRAKIPVRGQAKTVNLKAADDGYRTLLRIAAGIAVVFVVGFFTYQFFRGGTVESFEVLTDKNTEADTLPDGSGVFLNRTTKIEYTFDKREKIHTAKLEGEAYFNINHDDAKTFVVEAEGTFIKDIGTSFNVKAYPGSPTIEVVVEEGEVMFYTEANPGIYLKANGKGIYNKATKTFTVASPEPNVTAYKTKFFSFSNHTLASVVNTLNEVYPSKLRIDDNLKSCRLTVSFNDENIEEIAAIIAETLELTITRSGEIIHFKGTGCGEARKP
jgi:ferric-dicitrate binding protein FerR (iron transport regulator)